jgi:hypothetical protein
LVAKKKSFIGLATMMLSVKFFVTTNIFVERFAKWTPRVNFINILRTAFTLVDPKSVKNTVKS